MTLAVVLVVILNLIIGVFLGKLAIWIGNKIYNTIEERVENLIYEVKVDCGIIIIISFLGIFPAAVYMLIFKYAYIASLDLKKVLSQ